MHPLDLIKTRFQLQTSTSAQYTGVRDCVRKMYAQVTRATDILTTVTNKYFLVSRRDFSPSGKVFFHPFLWRLRKEPGSFSPLSSSRKCSCSVQTSLELWWVDSQV